MVSTDNHNHQDLYNMRSNLLSLNSHDKLESEETLHVQSNPSNVVGRGMFIIHVKFPLSIVQFTMEKFAEKYSGIQLKTEFLFDDILKILTQE